jgi:hypothetical protein
MTTTVPTQATDELRIVTTPPTIADAQLIVQMQQADAASGALRGWGHLQEFETPPTKTQLQRRFPKGSGEYQDIQAFLYSCETTATFVRQGILNEALVQDLYWVAGAWRMSEKLCRAARKEAGEPRILENFEWLASRAT